MATYYWVNGGGTWDSSTTGFWSLTSGGAGGAGVPTSVDDVIFNTLSGFSAFSRQVNCSGAVCRNITIAASTDFSLVPGSLDIHGSVTFSSTLASLGGPANLSAPSGSFTINVVNGFTFQGGGFYLGPGITSTATWTLAAALNLSNGGVGGGNGYLTLYSGTFSTSTFTITNYDYIGTEPNSYLGTKTFNIGAGVTVGTGAGFLQFQSGTVNLNAVAITCNYANFGVVDPSNDLVVTSAAGQVITAAVSAYFDGGKTGTTSQFRTINGAMSSFITNVNAGVTVAIPALTFTAGVEPAIQIRGVDNTAITNITTLTTSGIVVGNDTSFLDVQSGKLTGGAITIGRMRVVTPADVALTGTLTLNILNDFGGPYPLDILTNGTTTFAAITIPRNYNFNYPAINIQGSVGSVFSASGTVTIGDAINGRGYIELSGPSGGGGSVTFAGITAGAISSPGGSFTIDTVSLGATTLTGQSNSVAIGLLAQNNITITSLDIQTVFGGTSDFRAGIQSIQGNISIPGTTNVGGLADRAGIYLYAQAGSVSHGALNCSCVEISAATTVSQGAIVSVAPAGGVGIASRPVVSVQTGGAITTSTITADWVYNLFSDENYAVYSTTAGGAISFNGAISLGNATYRKKLQATVSGGSGAISYGAITASAVRFETPGNVTGTGTITLAATDNTVTQALFINVGGAATNTAATTAVSLTGYLAGTSTIFRTEGTGSVSFTNAITGVAGVTSFVIANSGGATFGGAVTGNTFTRSGGNLTLAAVTYTFSYGFTIAPGFTFTPSTSTIAIGNASAGDIFFGHGGYTYNAVTMTGRLGYVGDNAAGAGFTSATFSFTGVANPHARAIFYGDATITGAGAGALTFVGNSLINRLSVESADAGTAKTISCGNTRVLTNVDFTDITAAGGTTPWALGTSVGNCGGNSLINFTSAVTRYAVASGNWDNTAVWSATPFPGTPGASVPLPQDNVIVTAAAGAITLTVNSRRVLGGSIDMTGATATLSFAGNTYDYAIICGPVDIPSTVSVAGSTTSTRLLFSSRATQTYNYRPAASSDLTVAVYAPNNTVSQFGNFTTATFSVYAGTFTTQAGGAPPDYTLNTNGLIVGGMYNGFYGDPVFYGMAPNYAGVIALKLNSSAVICSSQFNLQSDGTIIPDTSTLTIKPTSGSVVFRWQGSGSLYNLAVDSSAALSTFATLALTATPSFTVSNQFAVTPSSIVPVVITGPATITLPNVTSPIASATQKYLLLQNLTLGLSTTVITNNVKYRSVTVTGPTLVAYGLANLNGNVNIDFASTLVTDAFTNINTAYTLPNKTDFILTVVGAGGQGAKPTSATATGGGGGGGGTAVLEAFSTLTPGSTVFVNAAGPTGTKTTAGAGTAGANSWVNLVSNTSPTLITQGIRGNGGNGGGATGTGGTGGTTLAPVGLGYTGGAAARGGGTAGLTAVGKNGAIKGGAGTSANAFLDTGGAGVLGGGGFGGTNSARTPTAASFGVNGGGGGGGGQVLQVQTTNQIVTRSNASSLCTISSVANHGLLNGETANISFSFRSGTYTTATLSNATISRVNASTTLDVTTGTSHNLTNGDTVGLTFTSRSGTYATTTRSSTSITRAAGSTTCTVITTTAHDLSNGNTINLVPVFRTGTYSRTGTLVTCNVTSHGLVNGQTYFIDFISGAALDGSYVVTVVTANQFRVTTVASGTTSGSLTIGGGSQLTAQNYTVTVVDGTTFTITTTQSTGFFSNATSTVRTPVAVCTITSHGLTNGQTYYLDFTSGSGTDGSYLVTVLSTSSFSVNLATTPNTSGNVTIGGSTQLTNGNYVATVTGPTTFTVTTVQSTGVVATASVATPFATMTVSSHGLTTGQTYYLDFTSGTGPDGSYVITSTGTNSFTTNLVTTPGASGNVTIGGSSQLTNGDYVVNVLSLTSFTITTGQTTGVAANSTSTLVNSSVFGGLGGNGTVAGTITYRSLNGVVGAGTIGIGGAGGGGGGANGAYGKGAAGGAGSFGAGGGGGGAYGTNNPSTDAGDGGSGGAGLVLITYVRARSISQTGFIV